MTRIEEETMMQAARSSLNPRNKAWIALVFVCCSLATAQQPVAAPDPQSPPSAQTSDTAESERPVSLKLLVPNILHDQKPIWTFPYRLAKGKDWKPFLGISLATAALVISDPYTEPYFRNSSGFKEYKTGALRGRNTTLAITLTPVAYYVTGLAKHSNRAKSTALLSAEAIADTQLLSLVMKHAAGRLLPSQIPPDGNFCDTWFKYNGTFTNGGSFPSGHAASAFAVATVIAVKYHEHRWITLAAYGAAGAIALTRLPDQAHFPSDIFFGAALGYTITHFVVLRKQD